MEYVGRASCGSCDGRSNNLVGLLSTEKISEKQDELLNHIADLEERNKTMLNKILSLEEKIETMLEK